MSENTLERRTVRGSISTFRPRPWSISPRVLEGLRVHLKSKILQQETMIDTIVDVLLSRVYREPDEDRPMAVFLINGKSGTGKTSIFNEIASYLQEFDDTNPSRISDFTISLSGYWAAELSTIVWGLSSGHGNADWDKPSKMEELDRKVQEKDSLQRCLCLFDEADKLITGFNSVNDGLTRLSEFFERSRIEPKRANATPIDTRNWIIFLTSNFFTQDVSATGKSIWFSIDGEQKTDRQREIEANETDPDEIKAKLERHLPNSLVNRLDAIIVTKDIMNNEVRRNYALEELRNIKKWVSDWYESLSDEKVSLDAILDEESLVTEILEKSNFQWGMRAIKRYARNFVKPKIIKELLQLCPLQDSKKAEYSKFPDSEYSVDIDEMERYLNEVC